MKSNIVAAVIAAGLGLSLHAAASPLDDLRRLARGGEPHKACEAGLAHPELFGDVAFDFEFGSACVEGGNPGIGVLALERYLLVDPDNLAARLGIARGYFLLRDFPSAKAEFAAVRKLSPPPAVAAAIDRYEAQMRQRRPGRWHASYALEAGGGRDTNVNAGPSAAEILLPGFGFLPLDAHSRAIADDFAMVAGSGSLAFRVDPRVSLFGALQAEQRWHASAEARPFEVGSYTAVGGIALSRDRSALRASAFYGDLAVGRDRYRSMAGGAAEWSQAFGPTVASASVVAARLRYGAENQPRDADLYAATAGLRRSFDAAWGPVASIGASVTRQHSRTGFDELVPRTFGLNAGISVTPAAHVAASVGYAYQRNHYQGPDFFAWPEARRDALHALDAAVALRLSPAWSLRLEASASRNRSNADVYAYRREIATLKLRYESP